MTIQRPEVRVLEKLGMTREATLRRHRLTRNGELVDELCSADLAERTW